MGGTVKERIEPDPALSEERLRRWLTLLRRPDQLASPELTELLRAHGKLPSNSSPLAVGQAGADLIVEAIDRLKPDEGAGREQYLPHEVLRICFVEGAKLFQAAGRLGMSERQLSRERARAIKLLKAELEGPLVQAGRGEYQAEPIPTIRGFLARPAEGRKLKRAIESAALTNLHGPPGIGKTSLVAEFAADVVKAKPVLWYRFRPGINVGVRAFLFELGEFLAGHDFEELSTYMHTSLAELDVGLATRVALEGLRNNPSLLVFDDYHLVEDDPALTAMLDEIASRLPDSRIITLSRHRFAGTVTGTPVEVGPLARTETEELLAKLGVTCTAQMLKTLHSWTGGNPHLVKLAASWLKTATDQEVSQGVASLTDQQEVQRFLLSIVTELIDSDDRAILEAASVFRDRFSDEALAYVSNRTRGAVVDSSLRLVRVYAATRSRSGDSAFFHTSVRDDVYDRLDTEQKAELHRRAADWYERQKNTTEAQYHQRRATEAVEPQESDGKRRR